MEFFNIAAVRSEMVNNNIYALYNISKTLEYTNLCKCNKVFKSSLLQNGVIHVLLGLKQIKGESTFKKKLNEFIKLYNPLSRT